MMKGQSVAGSEYAQLTGNTSFPNAAGRFLRNTGGDAPAIGQTQDDAIRNITGTFTATRSYYNVGPGATGSFTGTLVSGSSWDSFKNYGYFEYQFNASGSVPTANETRPKNLSVNYFIKINRIYNF